LETAGQTTGVGLSQQGRHNSGICSLCQITSRLYRDSTDDPTQTTASSYWTTNNGLSTECRKGERQIRPPRV